MRRSLHQFGQQATSLFGGQAGSRQTHTLATYHTCKATAHQKKLRPTKKGQWRRAEGQLSDFERSGRQIRDNFMMRNSNG